MYIFYNFDRWDINMMKHNIPVNRTINISRGNIYVSFRFKMSISITS